MRTARAVFLFLVTAFCAAAFGQADQLSSYKMGSGDMISIRVLGESKVKGMTVGALEQYITKSLKGRYLLNPQVNVSIDEYRNFFVNGMVEKPGGHPFAPGMTVRKAISLAGGLN